jgi:hypothetical protein
MPLLWMTAITVLWLLLSMGLAYVDARRWGTEHTRALRLALAAALHPLAYWCQERIRLLPAAEVARLRALEAEKRRSPWSNSVPRTSRSDCRSRGTPTYLYPHPSSIPTCLWMAALPSACKRDDSNQAACGHPVAGDEGCWRDPVTGKAVPLPRLGTIQRTRGLAKNYKCHPPREWVRVWKDTLRQDSQ